MFQSSFNFQSLNGVYKNGERLLPQQEYLLQDGDLIQMGIPPDPDKPPEFQWKFFSKLRVKKIKKTYDCIDTDESQGSQRSAIGEASHKRRRCAWDENKPSQSRKKSPVRDSASVAAGCSKWSPSTEMAYKLAEREKVSQQKMKEHKAELIKLQQMLKEKEDAEERMKEELVQKEKDMQDKMKKQQVLLLNSEHVKYTGMRIFPFFFG